MLAILVGAAIFGQAVPFTSGLALSRVSEGGRLPVARDQFVSELIKNPNLSAEDSKLPWKTTKATADGWFEGLSGGYVWTTFESPREQPMILEATGHGMVYINGEPRGGDPYGFGYLKLPFLARAGKNSFIFSGGRGRVKAELKLPKAALQLDTSDLTMPDILEGDKGRLFGGIVVINNTSQRVENATIISALGKKTVSTALPAIGAFSSRKVRFDFPVSEGDKIQVRLARGGQSLDEVSVDVAHKSKNQHHRRTFISRIDDSVQYFGVVPALKPSPSNALVLTLHGASVEGIGQAQAYAPKEWATIVAATNRRPYGFDWEDWGRLDALEVLDIAEKTYLHAPEKVFLTGHSMGGHGTWHIGTMFPERFGAMAPSAGWLSFWSYGGGWEPRDPNSVERILRASMNPSDTLQRIENLKDLGVYILHGDADDNVPVGQARTGRAALRPWHSDVQYHEQPGAGHWFGNESVDWPGIFEMFKRRSRNLNPTHVKFSTQNPSISGKAYWATIEQAENPMIPSSIDLTKSESSWLRGSFEGSTANVAALRISGGNHWRVKLDGQSVESGSGLFRKVDGRWRSIADSDLARQKNSQRGGPFKQAYQNHMQFVYGTKGTAEENAWAYAKARFDAENFYYRGNGAVDVVPDTSAVVNKGNLILYGNSETNGLWKPLLASAPIQVNRKTVSVGGRSIAGENLAAMFLWPRGSGDQLIGVVAGTGLEGSRLTDRLPVFVSGVAYPDWIVIDASVLAGGTKDVLGAGFFTNDWKLSPTYSAWK